MIEIKNLIVASIVIALTLSAVVIFLLLKLKPKAECCPCNCEECQECPSPSPSLPPEEEEDDEEIKCPPKDCPKIWKEDDSDLPIFVPSQKPILNEKDEKIMMSNHYIKNNGAAFVNDDGQNRLYIKDGSLYRDVKTRNARGQFKPWPTKILANTEYLYMNPNGLLQAISASGSITYTAEFACSTLPACLCICCE